MPHTPLATLPVGDFLARLASRTPAPGGGAVAALTGAHAAALAEMVLAFSDQTPAIEDVSHALSNARKLFLALADEDAAAYAEYTRLRKLDKADPERAERLPAAKAACLGAPRAVLAAATDLLRTLETLPGRTNAYLASDLAVAAVLAEACAAAAAHNVGVNLAFAADRDAVVAETESALADAKARRARVEAACKPGSA